MQVLTPILSSKNQKITIYREMYDELLSKGVTIFKNPYLQFAFEKIINNTVTACMDQIFILKIFYLHYIKHHEREYTVLFHGGGYHSEVYSVLINFIYSYLYNNMGKFYSSLCASKYISNDIDTQLYVDYERGVFIKVLFDEDYKQSIWNRYLN
jgi:hypothetical protein